MKSLLVIGGPTAAGKTALAIQIARILGTSIISADSRQFYKEMNIGTAKPDQHELAAVTHHFIDTLSVTDDYDIARFETETLKLLERLFKSNDTVIMVGGSGLYLEAVTKGLDKLPGRDEAIRNNLEQILKTKGLIALQDELIKKDPAGASKIDLNNPRRVIRALEICLATGIPYSTLQQSAAPKRTFNSLLIAITPDRDVLYERINQRVDNMMKNGLLEEVRMLLPYSHYNALRTVGYTELFDHLSGKHSLEEAVSLIKQHTRNYAKRQLTWFRNRSDYTWFKPEDFPNIIDFIERNLAN